MCLKEEQVKHNKTKIKKINHKQKHKENKNKKKQIR